uniref:Uncharacterized protein n=1 Tax=Anguilla anguilla TaxID=7936 RepID=A0A0E9WN14_ANGAN
MLQSFFLSTDQQHVCGQEKSSGVGRAVYALRMFHVGTSQKALPV